MRIGELAERAGTTTRALRYYEARGLLAARRDAHGHRVYGAADLRLVRQIRTLQEVGFGLEETRPFVECLRAGHEEGDTCPASLGVYRGKLAEMDALVAQVLAARARVATRLARAEAAVRALAGEAPPEPGCALAPVRDHVTARPTDTPTGKESHHARQL
ncbi:MerR family transcriptional regulator [Streptomyces sp. NPDC047046]|uniref:MerR family transcriptional regulator n=1 Tax=Streptomyces sp. NPDC047046 TaxID=3155378 RepID=UPI0033C320DB